MRFFTLLLSAILASSGATYMLKKHAIAQSSLTSVVADESTGNVRIVVDGKEVARFTADGLDVPGNIKFGGVISDTVPGSGP